MKFSFINLFNLGLIVVMLIPNIRWAMKNKNLANSHENSFIVIIEKLARIACLIFMIFPFFIGKFGFRSVEEMLVYFLVSLILIVTYLITWSLYFRKETRTRKNLLDVIPSILFVFCGILLRHWALLISGLVFFLSHLYISNKISLP